MTTANILELMRTHDYLLNCRPSLSHKHELIGSQTIVKLVNPSVALEIQNHPDTRTTMIVEPGCGPAYVVGLKDSKRLFNYEVCLEYKNRPDVIVQL